MQAWQKLYDDCGIIAVCAFEIEWYLRGFDGNPANDELRVKYLTQLNNAIADIPIHSCEAEQATGQVEVAMLPTANMQELLQNAQILKQRAQQIAQAMQLNADFSAKPFKDNYGSGLHVHIHLENLAKEQLFWVDDSQLSSHLVWSIGGMLVNMRKDLPIFAGSEAAMARYEVGFDAPTNLSWGFNNRTTALRLPDNMGVALGLDAILAARTKQSEKRYKRIEHRVASAQADVGETIAAILHSVHQGIISEIVPPNPTYGNAWDYDLPALIIEKYHE